MLDADGRRELPAGLRVVIAHDFMEAYGGAERVTAELAAAFPAAPVFAILGRRSVARRMGVEERFHSVMRRRPRTFAHYRLMAPAFPALLDRARLPEADVLVTSSYGFVHRLRTVNRAPQVCYCHSPLRFAWSMTGSYRQVWAGDGVRGAAFGAFAAAMRASDRAASSRVAQYLTQSHFTAHQIHRYYGREARVVGAPVDCVRFHPSPAPAEDFFLMSGRLVEPYKRPSIVVEAFRGLGQRLVVAGDGPVLAELRRNAPPNVEFVGHLADDELVGLMQRCAAAIFPSRDDFGLTPVEVMACGRPVLAFGAGGALHTVVPGHTGELFWAQRAETIAEAVRSFRPEAYDPQEIREHAMRWDAGHFRDRIVAAVVNAAGIPWEVATEPAPDRRRGEDRRLEEIFGIVAPERRFTRGRRRSDLAPVHHLPLQDPASTLLEAANAGE